MAAEGDNTTALRAARDCYRRESKGKGFSLGQVKRKLCRYSQYLRNELARQRRMLTSQPKRGQGSMTFLIDKIISGTDVTTWCIIEYRYE